MRPVRDQATGWVAVAERLQPLFFAAFFVGLLLWPFAGHRVALITAGSAVVCAGLVPFVTGRYRTRLARLDGTGARFRGLYSIVIGLIFIALGWFGHV